MRVMFPRSQFDRDRARRNYLKRRRSNKLSPLHAKKAEVQQPDKTLQDSAAQFAQAIVASAEDQGHETARALLKLHEEQQIIHSRLDELCKAVVAHGRDKSVQSKLHDALSAIVGNHGADIDDMKPIVPILEGFLQERFGNDFMAFVDLHESPSSTTEYPGVEVPHDAEMASASEKREFIDEWLSKVEEGKQDLYTGPDHPSSSESSITPISQLSSSMVSDNTLPIFKRNGPPDAFWDSFGKKEQQRLESHQREREKQAQANQQQLAQQKQESETFESLVKNIFGSAPPYDPQLDMQGLHLQQQVPSFEDPVRPAPLQPEYQPRSRSSSAFLDSQRELLLQQPFNIGNQTQQSIQSQSQHHSRSSVAHPTPSQQHPSSQGPTQQQFYHRHSTAQPMNGTTNQVQFPPGNMQAMMMQRPPLPLVNNHGYTQPSQQIQHHSNNNIGLSRPWMNPAQEISQQQRFPPQHQHQTPQQQQQQHQVQLQHPIPQPQQAHYRKQQPHLSRPSPSFYGNGGPPPLPSQGQIQFQGNGVVPQQHQRQMQFCHQTQEQYQRQQRGGG